MVSLFSEQLRRMSIHQKETIAHLTARIDTLTEELRVSNEDRQALSEQLRSQQERLELEKVAREQQMETLRNEQDVLECRLMQHEARIDELQTIVCELRPNENQLHHTYEDNGHQNNEVYIHFIIVTQVE